MQCHHVDGTCVTGCEPGFIGDTCKTGTSEMLPNTLFLNSSTHLSKAVLQSTFQFCFICITFSLFYNRENDTLTRYTTKLCKYQNTMMFYLSLIWQSQLNHSLTYNINILFIFFISPFYYFYVIIEKKVCDKGWYGDQCREQCGHCRDANQCLHTNGTCITGCMTGYYGDLCKTREQRIYFTNIINMQTHLCF